MLIFQSRWRHTIGVMTFSGVLLSACGGSDYDNKPTPTSPPDPVVVIEFPEQDANPAVNATAELGDILVSAQERSLYVFDSDTDGASSCLGAEGDAPGQTSDSESCAGRWPPLLAPAGTTGEGGFSTLERSDGTFQWRYNNQPLYTFANDLAAGDTNGDGLGGVWHLARPLPFERAEVNGVGMIVGKGSVLTASNNAGVFDVLRRDNLAGFSLYIFDVDGLGEATCYNIGSGECITSWPPLLADPGARPVGKYSIIEVEGQDFQQWAFNGKALYFFNADTVPGDDQGQGVGNVWWLSTNQAAIFRTVDGRAQPILSALGRANVLVPESEGSSDSFISTVVDKDQFTLYTFTNDEEEFVSSCSGQCAVNFPPFIAAEGDPDTGHLVKFEREPGVFQWAFNAKPLYFATSDTEPKTFEGENAVWLVVNPVPITAFITEETTLGETLAVNSEVNLLTSEGPLRQDKTGFQLYTFDGDQIESPACVGACLNAWPALLAGEGDVASAPFSIFEREDGAARQWALNGYPLYFFAADAEVGPEATGGEGQNGLWWVARPAPVRVSSVTLSDAEGAQTLIARGLKVLESRGIAAQNLQDLTLYTFDNDLDEGLSTCFDGCADRWPPLYATSADEAFGEFTVIARDEAVGTGFQWSYKGKPLYFFSGDGAPGDANGASSPNWSLATP